MKELRVFWACACALLLGLVVVGCSDDVDESDMYTFTGQLVQDFIEETEETSYFAYMTTIAKVSSKSESPVSYLLSARGNYTCFVPTNEAIQTYLDSVYSTEGYNYLDTPDSTADNIVLNCIIDNDDNDAYMTTDFPTESGSALEFTTFSDRTLTVKYDTIEGGSQAIYINTYSRIVSLDNEVENGVVHVVNRVITPSNATVPGLIGQAGNLKIFSKLLEVTGWDELMTDYRDYDYEESNPGTGAGCPTRNSGADVPTPDHRDQGYTAFVETDSVLVAGMGLPELVLDEEYGTIENWDELWTVIQAKCLEYYPDATDDDPTSEDNAVNQFVSYHLLSVGVTYDHIVVHYNEQGYSYTTYSLGIDAWEYYETMGSQRRILKITEGSQTDGKRINRYVSERKSNYTYDASAVEIEGILINGTNGDYDYAALNGYYYTIDDILVYNDDVPDKVLNERMRFDICSILPEQITNGFRRSYTTDQDIHIPDDYFENMSWTEESNVVYLPGYADGWYNYQGDEYNIQGTYDVTIKLPQVPTSGTYEFRIGLNSNSNVRSMCQFYFGTNPDNLVARGLPLDERKSGSDATIGWEEDGTDSDANDENDKVMRNHGYMKAPYYYGTNNSAGTSDNFRSSEYVLRYIAYTGVFEPGVDYYCRMKSVLEDTSLELCLDYFEFCPKSVYNNPLQAEDKW